jgi:hypothetical protein
MNNTVIPKIFPFVEESVNINYSENPDISSINIHCHNFIEFAYVSDGYGVETINQETFEVKPGYFSIIYPWQTHEIHFRRGTSLKYYHVAISMDNFFGAGSVALELKDLFFPVGIQQFNILHLFRGQRHGTAQPDISGDAQRIHHPQQVVGIGCKIENL